MKRQREKSDMKSCLGSVSMSKTTAIGMDFSLSSYHNFSFSLLLSSFCSFSLSPLMFCTQHVCVDRQPRCEVYIHLKIFH